MLPLECPPPKLLLELWPPKLPLPNERLAELPDGELERVVGALNERAGALDELVERLPNDLPLPDDGENVLLGCELRLPNEPLPKLRPVVDGVFTVVRVLLWRGVPNERLPLVDGLYVRLPLVLTPCEPKERLRSGLSFAAPRCRLPNERLPLERGVVLGLDAADHVRRPGS